MPHSHSIGEALQRSIAHSSGALTCNFRPCDASRCALEAIEITAVALQVLCTRACFKSCYLRLHFLISLKLGVSEIPPFGTLTCLGIISTKETYQG